MNHIAPGEIVYCTLTIQHKRNQVITKPTIFSLPYVGGSMVLDCKDVLHAKILDANGIKESCSIVGVKVVSRHGFRNR